MARLPEDRSALGILRWSLGRDTASGLLAVLGFAVVYVVLDEGIDRWAQAPGSVYMESSLLLGAITEQLPLTAIGVLFAAVLAYVGRTRLMCRWADLELGVALRWFVIPLIALLTWRSAFYEYHFVYDQWHAVDRVLVAVLGLAAVARPVFLLPFVVQVTVISWQFGVLLGSTAGMNVDAPATAVLLTVGIAVLAHVVFEVRAGLTALWLSGVVVAAWFFLPGRRKVGIDWFATDPADFARTSETAGWLGNTSGGFNDFMVDLLSTFRWPVLIGTLVLEVGAVFAVLSRRTMLWWIPGWISLHAFIFAASGFWLFPWVIVEAGLFVAYRTPDVRAAFAGVGGVARSALAVVMVLVGAQLFDPAGLAWIDSPVGQAYEVEVVGRDGNRYNVPLSAFEPVGLELAFMTLGIEDPLPAIGAYGALGSRWEHDALAEMMSFEEFDRYRAGFGPPDPMQQFYGRRILLDWVEYVNEHGDPGWFPASPLPRVWSARRDPVHAWEPIERLELIRVDVLHRHDEIRRTVVFIAEVGTDGAAAIIDPGGS